MLWSLRTAHFVVFSHQKGTGSDCCNNLWEVETRRCSSSPRRVIYETFDKMKGQGGVFPVSVKIITVRQIEYGPRYSKTRQGEESDSTIKQEHNKSQKFLCRLRSIATHRDHFVCHPSVCPSVCLSVCLSVCHTGIAMFRRRHMHSSECCHYF